MFEWELYWERARAGTVCNLLKELGQRQWALKLSSDTGTRETGMNLRHLKVRIVRIRRLIFLR